MSIIEVKPVVLVTRQAVVFWSQVKIAGGRILGKHPPNLA